MDGDAACIRQGIEDAREVGGKFFFLCDQEECRLCVDGGAFAVHHTRELYGNPLKISEAVDGLCEVVEAVLTGGHRGLVGRGRHCITAY